MGTFRPLGATTRTSQGGSQACWTECEMGYRRIADIRVDPELERRLPSADGSSFSGLVDDVRRRGIVVDLLVTQDGLLLDGHRRLRAAQDVGLTEVPVKEVQVTGSEGWEQAVAVAVNLHRRHLSEAERANLGSSLLRLERQRAKERQREGQRRGRERRKSKDLVVGNRSPQPPSRQPCRATAKTAEAVGVSRKTFERMERIKKGDPELAQSVLARELSIAAAYERVRAAERRKAVDAGRGLAEGRAPELSAVSGTYRTVYLDPERSIDTGSRLTAAKRLALLEKTLKDLPLHELAHEDGCHYWIWTPWPMVRSGVLQELLRRWKLRWVFEVVWDNRSASRTACGELALLVVATSGKPSFLCSKMESLVREKSESADKPTAFYHLIENSCLGPRIELFAQSERVGWDWWVP